METSLTSLGQACLLDLNKYTITIPYHTIPSLINRSDKIPDRYYVWKVEFYLEVLLPEFYISVLYLAFNFEKHDSLLSRE